MAMLNVGIGFSFMTFGWKFKIAIITKVRPALKYFRGVLL